MQCKQSTDAVICTRSPQDARNVIKFVKLVPWLICHVPDHFKTEEMCNDAVWVDPLHLKYVPDHFKKQEMCDKAVRDNHARCYLYLIALLQGSGYICGMMTVNIVMMMMMMMMMIKIIF